jgi:predicted HTH transcriptional regulator
MNKITDIGDVTKATEPGECQFIEFKESFDKSLAREIVAFANASGGVILLCTTDAGQIKGIEISNRLESQIQDTAYNCDPAIILSIADVENVLVVEVLEGKNKPYSCSAGFYMRMGANAQKMSRDACAGNGNNVEFRFTDAFWITMHSNQKDTDRVPDRVTEHLTENQQALLNLIAQDSTVSMLQMSEHIGISKRKVLDNINKLKAMGIIIRSGSKKGGHWQIIDK